MLRSDVAVSLLYLLYGLLLSLMGTGVALHNQFDGCIGRHRSARLASEP